MKTIPDVLIDSDSFEKKREIAKARYGKPFMLETKIARKEQKSQFLINLEKEQKNGKRKRPNLS
jgi:hypothetical protein